MGLPQCTTALMGGSGLWDSLVHYHTAGCSGQWAPCVHYHTAGCNRQWDSFNTATLLGSSGQPDSVCAGERQHGTGVPLDQCNMHFRTELGSLPRTTLEVGWWLRGFRRANSTVLVQRPHHHHVRCVSIGAFTAGGACSSEAASTAYLILAISPERMPLTHGCHRPPPGMPNPGIHPRTLGCDTCAQPSPVDLTGDPVCVWGGDVGVWVGECGVYQYGYAAQCWLVWWVWGWVGGDGGSSKAPVLLCRRTVVTCRRYAHAALWRTLVGSTFEEVVTSRQRAIAIGL